MESEHNTVFQPGQDTGFDGEMVSAVIVEPEKEVKPERRHRWGIWVSLVLLMLVAAGAVAVFLNREWIYDFYRGMSYEPSAEMEQIKEKLQLTDRGQFIFNAVWPELSGSEKFNEACRSEADAEVAILGCYTEGNIYVYNIASAELEGIREATTAHELLHAVYARMSEEEKSGLASSLREVYENNRDILEEDLKIYATEEKDEELYVRAGTEVKDLPAELEKHYAEIFQDQDLIAGFYDNYIAVFREIEEETGRLNAELEALNEDLTAKINEYERRLEQFNANVVSFNACAEVMGCFGSEEEFEARRGALLSEQDALDVLYDEISASVEYYNTKVEEYNNNVTRSEKLNQMINSVEKVEGVN